MIDAPLALAFAAGMVATVNPCGFAMLPAYLAYFLGIDARAAATDDDARTGVARAIVVGVSVSAGFVAVFAVIGAIVQAGAGAVQRWSEWITIGIGLVLVGLGIAMLSGFHLNVITPRLDKGGRRRTVGSMVLFGVSYGVASVGCALPVFLTWVATTFSRQNVASGVAAFIAYALGMTLLLTGLTVTLALARQSLLRLLRRALPHMDRIAGALLVLSGGYLAYYWAFNLATDTGSGAGSGPARWLEDQSAKWSTRLNDWGTVRVGVVMGVVIAAAVGVLVARPALQRRRGRGATVTVTATVTATVTPAGPVGPVGDGVALSPPPEPSSGTLPSRATAAD